MRVLFMGAGSLGSVSGGLMAHAGHEVTLVGRAPHMNAIAADGLRITGIWGEYTVDSLNTRTDLAGLERGDFDWIFIAVKSYDTEEAIRAVAPLVDDKTLVCSYQNGLGNAEIIAREVGWERCVGARVIYGAWLPENGIAEVTVIADDTALGAHHPSTPTEAIGKMARTMNDAGIPTTYTTEIATVLWSKLAYNCALNPMSALLDVPYGALLQTQDTRAIMREVIIELYAVGDALNICLDPDSPEGYIQKLFEVLIPATAEHYASMREDFRRRRRTEVDALNGAIADHGAEHGIPCPVNQTLSGLVKARERTYLSPKAP